MLTKLEAWIEVNRFLACNDMPYPLQTGLDIVWPCWDAYCPYPGKLGPFGCEVALWATAGGVFLLSLLAGWIGNHYR